MGVFTLYTLDVCKSSISWLSDVHDSDARQLPKIPRRDVPRTRLEQANRRRVMAGSPRRESRPPPGRPAPVPCEPSTRRSITAESTAGALDPPGIESRRPG